MNNISKLDITKLIHTIRDKKVILDFDLALLYKVENKALKRQVRTNKKRFPEDFMFQLTKDEWVEQVQKLHLFEKYHRIKSLPFAFTEQGVAMLSSVLRSDRAIEVNIEIMRAFVEQRKFLLSNEILLKEIYELRREVDFKFLEHDEKFEVIFEAIRKMLEKDIEDNDRKIGFDTGV